MTEWISTEDVGKLPPIGKAVIVGNPLWARSCIGALKDAATMDWVGYLDQNEERPEGDPTHWMPIPEPPHPGAAERRSDPEND